MLYRQHCFILIPNKSIFPSGRPMPGLEVTPLHSQMHYWDAAWLQPMVTSVSRQEDKEGCIQSKQQWVQPAPYTHSPLHTIKHSSADGPPSKEPFNLVERIQTAASQPRLRRSSEMIRWMQQLPWMQQLTLKDM